MCADVIIREMFAQPDTDCANNALCCFDGCGNTCYYGNTANPGTAENGNNNNFQQQQRPNNNNNFQNNNQRAPTNNNSGKD